MNVKDFKNHFYFSENQAQLNNAGQAQIPDVNKICIQKWTDRFFKEGALCAMEGWNQTEVTRNKLAKFIKANPNEVAFVQTTASALSQAAFGIPLNEGDEILTWDQEYPSNFYPWRIAAERRKAKLIQVHSTDWRTPYKSILEQVNAKTKVIAISWVQYQTGSVTDLKVLSEKLKNKNIWLVADVIQGLGVRPFDFHDSGFDIICGGSHKWLCSGYGASFFVIKQDKISSFAPLEYGAMTYGYPETEKSFSIQPKPSAHRFEPGSKAMLEVIALGETLDLFEKFGIENIFSEACRLADKLRNGLSSISYQIFSKEGPIVCFAPQKITEIDTLAELLTKNKVSFAKRGPGIRLSCHAYNRDEEIEFVLDLLNRSF